MRFPKLVRIARQAVTVRLDGAEMNEDGEIEQGAKMSLMCNLQLKAFERLTADKRTITLSGKALFDGDICPDGQAISGGKLTYNGQTWTIYRGQRNYNPDGTVNYTTLELM